MAEGVYVTSETPQLNPEPRRRTLVLEKAPDEVPRTMPTTDEEFAVHGTLDSVVSIKSGEADPRLSPRVSLAGCSADEAAVLIAISPWPSAAPESARRMPKSSVPSLSLWEV